MKAPNGFTGFNEITRAGLSRGRTTLLVGGRGSGKTLIARQCLMHGAQDCKEPGIFVVFEDIFRWHRKIAALIGLIAAMNLVVLLPAASGEDKVAGLSSMLGELRKGGLVIYFRHGATDQTGSSDEAADMMKCETQRNLSAEGRRQATQIGKAFHTLRIPIGTVTTSPFCRTKDTAKLAFGRFSVSNDLSFAIGTDANETKRITESLRRMLSTPPAKATNAVIVSHTANLREAAGIWPKPEGVAYVFRPLPGGKFEAIAMVLPEDWGKIVQLKSSSKSK